MDANEWNSQKGSDKLKTLLRSAGLSLALAQASWASLTKAEKAKIERASKGSKGWHEEKAKVSTPEGIKEVAPRHRAVAVKKALEDTERVPMVVPEPKKEAEKNGHRGRSSESSDPILDELLKSSSYKYRGADKSELRLYARNYAQAVYNYLLNSGIEPDVPEKLKQVNDKYGDIDVFWKSKTNWIYSKAVEAAKKTSLLRGRGVSAKPHTDEAIPIQVKKELWEMTRKEFDADTTKIDFFKKKFDETTTIRRFEVGTKVLYAEEEQRQGWKGGKDYCIRDSHYHQVYRINKDGQRLGLRQDHKSLLNVIKHFTASSQGTTIVDSHYLAIQKAISEGKPVPPVVLADYPDLKEEKSPAPPKEEKIRDTKITHVLYQGMTYRNAIEDSVSNTEVELKAGRGKYKGEKHKDGTPKGDLSSKAEFWLESSHDGRIVKLPLNRAEVDYYNKLKSEYKRPEPTKETLEWERKRGIGGTQDFKDHSILATRRAWMKMQCSKKHTTNTATK